MTALDFRPSDRAYWVAALEALEPQPEVDVFGLLEYEPTPKQAEFHAATEFSVLFGGSAGGGKSRAITAHALRECIRHPGIRVGAFRRTYPELEESLLAELAELGFGRALGASWNGTKYNLTFPNGSRIMFRYAESIQDATRRQGGQYQLLLFDELTLMSPQVAKFLESRLRSGRADIPVLGVRATANPGGVGHGAVRDRWIDATDYGKKVITDIRSRTVRFIPSKLSDNPHVNPEYAMDLMALDGDQRAAFLDGNWDAFQGAMFPALNRDRHVLDPIDLPFAWKRYNGIDWGFTAHWAVLWAAVDEDKRVWIYREIYKQRVGESDQAQQILAAEAPGEHVSVRFADDAMWATRGDAKPIADVYADEGVHLTKAGKGAGSRVHGWQRIRSYLGEAPACPHHRALGWDTCPRLHIFSTCADTFKELRDLPHAVTGNPEDADPRAPDHIGDALRYLLTNLEEPPPADLFRPLAFRNWHSHLRGGSCAGRVWALADSYRFGTLYLPLDVAHGDAVACAWARTVGGDLILLDRVRMPAVEANAERMLGTLVRMHELDAVYVPRRQLTELLRKDAYRAGTPLALLDAESDPLAQALPAAEAVAAGKVWLPVDAPWRQAFVAELATFPANERAVDVEVLAAAVRVANTRWIPAPTPPAQPEADPFAALGGHPDTNLLSVPL